MQKKQLLEGPIPAQVRHLSYPIVGGLVAINASSLADLYFISRLGTEQLAAFGFMMPVILVFLSIGWGLSIGAVSVLSRAYGEGRLDRVRRLLTDSIVIGVSAVLVTSTLGQIFMPHMFKAMGASDTVYQHIHAYLSLWYPAQFIIAFCSIANGAFRASGDTRLAGMAMALTAMLNILLDPLLIFGLGPFPAMGIAGAAMANISSFILSAIVLAVILMRRQMLAHLAPLADFLFSARKILHVGLPAMLTQLITPLSASIIIWMVADFGKEAVAAMAIAARIEALALIFFYSMASGMMVFAGQNAGAGNFKRIQKAIRITAGYSISLGLIMAALFWIGADAIPALFNQDLYIRSYAAHWMHIVPASLGFLGITLIAASVFNAIGNPLPSTTLMLARGLIIYVPLAWIGKLLFGFHGIMAATLVANVAIGILAYYWSRKGSLRLDSTLKQHMRQDALPLKD